MIRLQWHISLTGQCAVDLTALQPLQLRVSVVEQTVVDSMDFWKKEPNSHILTETDPEKFFRFFMGRVLKKEDGSKWNDEELKLLHEL